MAIFLWGHRFHWGHLSDSTVDVGFPTKELHLSQAFVRRLKQANRDVLREKPIRCFSTEKLEKFIIKNQD